jgi:hypothetical protein
MTTLLPRRTHTTVVERIFALFAARCFVAEITDCLDDMRTILNYTAIARSLLERSSE